VFTDRHDVFWAAARRAYGDGAGTRALIEVLLLHRHLPTEQVLAGIDAVLKAGATDPALVAIEARRLADTPACPVVPLTRAAGHDHRPAPTLAGYDALLGATQAACVTPIGPRP
jgi:hypothetical protein